MDNIYLYAIFAYYDIYMPQKTKRILKRILDSEAILSNRKRYVHSHYGFNGLDYISLCDYSKRFLYNNFNFNAYNTYIRESLSLILSGNLMVVTPTIIQFKENNLEHFQKMKDLGLSTKGRYSDFYDEVQVKDKVPLSYMMGVTIPLHKMNSWLLSGSAYVDVVMKNLMKIKYLLHTYGYDIPIYDIDTMEQLDDDAKTKKLIMSYYGKK